MITAVYGSVFSGYGDYMYFVRKPISFGRNERGSFENRNGTIGKDNGVLCSFWPAFLKTERQAMEERDYL